MKGKQVNSYVKQGTGNRVFVYEVTGTPAELEAFKQAQIKRGGDEAFVVTSDGRNIPLWFSTRSSGTNCTLGISKNGNIYADNTELANLQSLAKQYPEFLGAINQKVATILFTAPIPTRAAVAEPAVAEPAVAEPAVAEPADQVSAGLGDE